jgi:hypothetical protein
MAHVTEDDLILHYYGELAAAEQQRAAAHLADCAACRQEFTRLQRVLGVLDESSVAPDVPDAFEAAVWARLAPTLRGERRHRFSRLVLAPAPLALAAAVLVLVGAAFFAGRVSSPARNVPAPAGAAAEQVRERVLLVALGEHLDQSQMILIELVSAGAGGGIDVSRERARAEHLLAANRLYRQTAATTGDTAMGDLLEELERVLVEFAAGPERLSSQDLEAVRRQIEGQGLLFKVRVVSSEVRERQKADIRQRTSPGA